MKTILHKADSRGHADHGWLNSYHSFSFANYFDPNRMNFGALRVLNDDTVAAGRGFGRHPHSNMEIISIPLQGDLKHMDNMGNSTVIREGDIQVMSAGTGVEHSEFNNNMDSLVKFLQIWIIPNKENVQPRYDQISLSDLKVKNKLYQVLSPNPEDQGVWIHQNAWFHMGDFDKGQSETYALKSEENGAYIFVLEGEVSVEGTTLNARDGFGIWDVDSITFQALNDAKFLIMEVPMEF
ncbi:MULTISPECIES: pirin family protein [Maribacter]|uniref:Pirin family protein n=1 Tax=Maribacter flavus TaxID=1658664 RepID=A0ABU7ILK0_9FLAO|nr:MULTISPECIES: pirin family protein [Maribacter]MDC6406722.1 pirin family protein [Maribacter sp. PR66]MEE1973836.1 pirin family protein [Maribacter flavus]